MPGGSDHYFEMTRLMVATVVFITLEQWEVKCGDRASTIGAPSLPSFRLLFLEELPMEALTDVS